MLSLITSSTTLSLIFSRLPLLVKIEIMNEYHRFLNNLIVKDKTA